MNKSIKGAIAIAAAGALLLGGSTSLAYWTASADIAPASLSAGHLTLALDSGVWQRVLPAATERIAADPTVVAADPAATAFDPAVDRIVPGDVVSYTVNATVDGSGSTLKAKLTANLGRISGTNNLPAWITTTLTVGDQWMAAAAEPPFVDLGIVNGVKTYPVTVQFTFDPITPNFKGQDGTVALSGMKLVLTQIP